MTQFAEGKYAFGFCDRCGFRYDLKELKDEVVDTRLSGFLVCPECFDQDQPQYQLGRMPVDDPISLENPRPDKAQAESRRLYAFDPIGGGVTAAGSRTVGLDMHGKVGMLKVTTS
jgi:hypothetical protein